MVSIQIFLGLTVAIVSMDAQGSITSLQSTPTGLVTPTVTHHHVTMRHEAEYDLLLNIDISQPQFIYTVEFLEAVLFLDGLQAAYRQIPTAMFTANEGQYRFTAFTDRTTGTVKTVQFRALTAGTMSQLPFATSMATDR